MLKINLLKMKS